MLKKNAVLDTKYVGYNPIRGQSPRISSMDNHEVALRHNHPGLIFESWRKALDEIEQSLAPRLDVRTVLDVVGRPELLRRSVVTFVEQRVEPFQNEPFVLLSRRIHRTSP